jgi:hypothetical protein
LAGSVVGHAVEGEGHVGGVAVAAQPVVGGHARKDWREGGGQGVEVGGEQAVGFGGEVGQGSGQ